MPEVVGQPNNWRLPGPAGLARRQRVPLPHRGRSIDSIGLAYLPDGAPYLGKPRRDGEIGYQEFDGDWYSFVQRF
ncbi:hypothetical protein AB9M10_14030 [Rhodococcus erythropolis]